MIGPLKSNLALSMRLIRNLKKNVVMKEAAKSIFVTTQMLMLHANDLLDLRIIERGSFVPAYVESDIYEMIMQVIKVVKFTQNDKELQIDFEKPEISPIKFDQRRLQQVTLNLLLEVINQTTSGKSALKITAEFL